MLRPRPRRSRPRRCRSWTAARARSTQPPSPSTRSSPPPSSSCSPSPATSTGSEREFSGKTRTFDHVVARTLVFESEEGALAYLGWLRGHGDDVLGRADPAKIAPPGDAGVAFTLEHCGTCKKELPTFLAGWQRGETVLTLLAAGSGANPARFTALAREHDQAAT